MNEIHKRSFDQIDKLIMKLQSYTWHVCMIF
jgi:hypothetical protein